MEPEAATLSRMSVELGGRQSFALMQAHYIDVDLQAVAKGFLTEYSDAELDSFEESARPHVTTFAALLAPGPEAEGTGSAVEVVEVVED